MVEWFQMHERGYNRVQGFQSQLKQISWQESKWNLCKNKLTHPGCVYPASTGRISCKVTVEPNKWDQKDVEEKSWIRPRRTNKHIVDNRLIQKNEHVNGHQFKQAVSPLSSKLNQSFSDNRDYSARSSLTKLLSTHSPCQYGSFTIYPMSSGLHFLGSETIFSV